MCCCQKFFIEKLFYNSIKERLDGHINCEAVSLVSKELAQTALAVSKIADPCSNRLGDCSNLCVFFFVCHHPVSAQPGFCYFSDNNF